MGWGGPPARRVLTEAGGGGRMCVARGLVVNGEQPTRTVALEAVLRVEQFEVDIAGAIFSRVDMKRGARYGGYGAGYYGDASKYYIN